MKTRFPNLLGCVAGLAAVVIGFMGLTSPRTSVEPSGLKPAIITKSPSRTAEVENRKRLSTQPGITASRLSERVVETAASRSRVSSPQVIPPSHSAESRSLSESESNPSDSFRNQSGSAITHRAIFASRDPAARSALPHGEVSLTQPFRNSREYQPPSTRAPVIFTEPGSILSQDPARDAALLEAANQLASDLTAPGHAPNSPEYFEHWNRTVDLSNQLLRQRFGGQVWMAHHIQSHHLRSANGEGD